MKARLRKLTVNPFTLNIKNRLEWLAQQTVGKPITRSIRKMTELRSVIIKDGKLQPGNLTSLQHIETVTAETGFNKQLVYFTSSSLTNDKKLIILSDRSGHPNLFVRDLENGREKQLSNNTDGLLKSYVYFHGRPYHGLGKASPCVHQTSGTVYYIQGRQIYKASANDKGQVLATLPYGQLTAYTHISADGKLLCVPTIDERALDGGRQLHGRPSYNIDERVRREGLNSYLHLFDTESGKEIANEVIPKAWVTHVQFSPTNNNLILYNHEWASQSGIRRMWLWDGKRHLQLRNEQDGRNLNDWVCHEVWSRNGGEIIYHGKNIEGRHFIGKITPHTGEIIELPLPRGWNQYGHYNLIEPNTLITDGHFRALHPKLTLNCPWLCRVDVDWLRREMLWTPLAAHLSSWASQDAHPHPILDPTSKYIYFTSDKNGKLAIYRTPLQTL